MTTNPYEGIPAERWLPRTQELVEAHPLSADEIVEVVLDAWEGILTTRIAGVLEMGVDVKPSPQIMGNYLHEVVPVLLSQRYPGVWRKDEVKNEKDLVYIPNDQFSTEIKTSSNKSTIFANRSYAQPSPPGAKPKDGYYLAINFQKFTNTNPPQVSKIALGWLSHSDWIPQAAATGQQAYLSVHAKLGKFVALYTKSRS